MSLRSLLRSLGRALLSLVVALLFVGVAWYAHYLWSGPELKPWHRARLTAEFSAKQLDRGEVTTLVGYIAQEQRVLDQVRTEVYDRVEKADRSPLNRYFAGSLSDPRAWPFDGNRTFMLEPSGPPVAGCLLLHGLTDSPYSLHSIGVALAARGCFVVGLRLPGHGTTPSGLLTVEVEDMQAATRLAMRDLRERLGPTVPLHMVGYSNGAALSVDYALAARDDAQLPKPASLVLISPAIGITRLAALTRIETGLSELQGFGRAAWSAIEPELDPFKYQSFSFHAAGITQRLTSTLSRHLARLAEAGPVRGMPPTLAFVSTVDSTVHSSAVVDALLGRLAPEGHELVLFDVNRYSAVQSLLVNDPGPLTRRLLEQPQRPYALSLVTNANPDTLDVVERRVPANGTQAVERPLGLAWPVNVFSLSHVALTFPPDDPLYGYAAPHDPRHLQLGRVEVRGESGVLNVPTWLLTRQRSNPFHAYLVERTLDFVGLSARSTVQP